ncbi:MAG: hypothetical protein ACYDCO_07665 [Armatimonadota bacterium]
MPAQPTNLSRQDDARSRIVEAVRHLVATAQPVTLRAIVAAAHTSFSTVQKHRADWEPLLTPPPMPDETALDADTSHHLLSLLHELMPRPLDEYLLGCTPDEVTPAMCGYWIRQMQRLERVWRRHQVKLSAVDYRQYAERVNVLMGYGMRRFGCEAVEQAVETYPPPDEMPWPADGRFLDLPLPAACRPAAAQEGTP